MKKKFLYIFFLIPLLMSCKHFLLNNNVVTELEDAIEWVNSKNFDISIKAEEGTGKLGIPEIATVRVKETIHLIFSVNQGFVFEGWHAVRKSDPSVFMDDYVSFNNSQCAITDVTILKYDEDILLIPFCNSKDSLRITFISNGGIITPSGSQIYYKDDEITLGFTPNYGYTLLSWNIYETTTKKTSDALSIRQEDGKYKVKVLNTDANITIEAPCALYPNAVYHTPESISSACEYRDETIRVLFDQPMSEDSIYYTTEELSELPQGCTLLESSYAKDSNGNKKVYGYVLNGQKIWKNIKIYINSAVPENILDCYLEPRFLNESILLIYVNRENLPPKNKNILIQLSTDFYNVSKVKIPEAIEWNCYFDENSSTDTTPPLAEKLVLSSVTSNGIESYDSCTNQSKYPSISQIKNFFGENIKCLYLNENKLKIDAKIYDIHSGIKEFYVTYIPVCDEHGLLQSAQQERKIPLEIDNYGKTASCNIILDFSSYFDPKYSYKISFIMTDNAEQSCSPHLFEYYISADYAPKVSDLDIITVQKEADGEVSIKDRPANDNLGYYMDHQKYKQSPYSNFPYSKSRKIRIKSEISYNPGINSITYSAKRVINEKQKYVTENPIILGTFYFNTSRNISENREIDLSGKTDGVYYISMTIKDRNNKDYLYYIGYVLLDNTPVEFDYLDIKGYPLRANLVGRIVIYPIRFNIRGNNGEESYENCMDMTNLYFELKFNDGKNTPFLPTPRSLLIQGFSDEEWYLSLAASITQFSAEDHRTVVFAKCHLQDCWGNISLNAVTFTLYGDGSTDNKDFYLIRY